MANLNGNPFYLDDSPTFFSSCMVHLSYEFKKNILINLIIYC